MLVRDLDFTRLKREVAKAADPIRRTSYSARIDDLRAGASGLEVVRNLLVGAALDPLPSPEAIDPSRRAVEALLRVLNHPAVPPVPAHAVPYRTGGRDPSRHLAELAATRPDLGWDRDLVERLLEEELRQVHGERELGAPARAWEADWGPATSTAHALFLLVTLRALGEA